MSRTIRRSRHTGTRLALALSTLAFACDPLVSPPAAASFHPPMLYRSLWRSVESCSGVTGDINAVSWFVTDGSAGARGDDDVAGSYWRDVHSIYLNQYFVADYQVVRHEMLHALRRGEGHGREFVDECGGLVICEGDCLDDAGGRSALPTEASPVILPEELEVTVTVLPPLGFEDGWASVIVAARNPRDEPVWVDLSGRPGEEFMCLSDGFPCGEHFVGSAPRSPFRAGETRREATVFPSIPGRYEVVGSFNTNVAAPVTLVVPSFSASRDSP